MVEKKQNYDTCNYNVNWRSKWNGPCKKFPSNFTCHCSNKITIANKAQLLKFYITSNIFFGRDLYSFRGINLYDKNYICKIVPLSIRYWRIEEVCVVFFLYLNSCKYFSYLCNRLSSFLWCIFIQFFFYRSFPLLGIIIFCNDDVCYLFLGCGNHIESALKDVPVNERCKCPRDSKK